MVLPPAAQALISGYGWRAAYFVLGGAVLVFGIPLTALFVRERPQGLHSVSLLDGWTVAQALRSRIFWILCATLVLGSLSVNGAITHLSPLLTDRAVSATTAALAASEQTRGLICPAACGQCRRPEPS